MVPVRIEKTFVRTYWQIFCERCQEEVLVKSETERLCRACRRAERGKAIRRARGLKKRGVTKNLFTITCVRCGVEARVMKPDQDKCLKCRNAEAQLRYNNKKRKKGTA